MRVTLRISPTVDFATVVQTLRNIGLRDIKMQKRFCLIDGEIDDPVGLDDVSGVLSVRGGETISEFDE